jgi:hypothetical protein
MFSTRSAEDEGEPRGVRAARGPRRKVARGSCERDHESDPREAEGHGRKRRPAAYVSHCHYYLRALF